MSKPFVSPQGPVVMVDIDDTLVNWRDKNPLNLIEFEINGIISYRSLNKHNVQFVKELAETGHVIILWSKSGVLWAETVMKRLRLEPYVTACISKPSYFIDDKPNPKEWMGHHKFFDNKGEDKSDS